MLSVVAIVNHGKAWYQAGAARSGTSDPLLVKRIERERVQIDRVQSGLARRLFLIGLQGNPPVGLAALERLATERDGGAPPI